MDATEIGRNAGCMGYVNETLGETEEVLANGSFDWKLKFDVGFYAVATLTLGLLIQFLGNGSLWLQVPTLCLTVYTLYLLIDLMNTEMAVTTIRVVRKTGWVARRTKELRLTAIETVQFHQSFVGRLLNCRAALRVTGRGGESITFHKMSPESALAVKSAIESTHNVR